MGASKGDKQTDKDDVDDNNSNASAGDADGIATGEDSPVKKEKKRKRKRKRKKVESFDGNDIYGEEEQAESTSDGSALDQNTIFVEGIPFDKTHDDVRRFFEKYNIPSMDILELRLPIWQDSERLRGFGHVKFGSKESYNMALGLNRKYMGKRYLAITPAKSRTGSRSGKSVEDPSIQCPDGCVTIFVNNLPYKATEDDIAEVFSEHTPNSNIAEDGVRIARNSQTRLSKGFAYIDFETSEDAQKFMKAAVKKNVIMEGRIIRLDYDTGRMKGSFRDGSGRLVNKNHED